MRLHEKGLIENPVGKSKSLVLTEDGVARAEWALARVLGLAVQPGSDDGRRDTND